MVAPRHRWLFPDPIRLAPDYRAAAAAHGLGHLAAAVLARRGVTDAAALEAYLGPADAGLHDPHLLPDAGLLLDRVARARADGERVLVFGDFDADGLTGLATLVLALRRLEIDAVPYVPSRLDEGHGLSLAAVEFARSQDVRLIITVDTGSSSVGEVAAAAAAGIDVCITDHHRVPSEVPAALALVNPHRPGATYPDPGLAGSGVAFTVARLLLGSLAQDEAAALALADLATIGTVSDVAPLLGENRAIARLGLELMRTAPRPGIAALLARAGVMPAKVDIETVGFVLAPRLNAAGRVGEAMDAALLLLAEDVASATERAAVLERANTTRRDLMRSALVEARDALGLTEPGQAPGQQSLFESSSPGDLDLAGPQPPRASTLVAGGPDAPALLIAGDWPVGIIGLVAGRLADATGVPAVVATRIGDVFRASCRGDGRVDLAATLAACSDLCLRHGGHAAAAGFEIPADRWGAFTERFLAAAGTAPPPGAQRTLAVDLALPAAYVDYSLLRDLARLAPCGTGNPEPLVAVLGLTVQRVRAANGGHAQIVLRRERDVIDGIAFGRSDLAESLADGDRVDVVARLVSRVFGGLETMQLEIRDVAASGSHARAAEVLERAAGRRGGVAVVQTAAAPVLAGGDA